MQIALITNRLYYYASTLFLIAFSLCQNRKDDLKIVLIDFI